MAALLSACVVEEASVEAPPVLNARASGEVEIAFESGCTILYGPSGTIITAGSSCSAEQRVRAQQAFNAHLAENDPSTYAGV